MRAPLKASIALQRRAKLNDLPVPTLSSMTSMSIHPTHNTFGWPTDRKRKSRKFRRGHFLQTVKRRLFAASGSHVFFLDHKNPKTIFAGVLNDKHAAYLLRRMWRDLGWQRSNDLRSRCPNLRPTKDGKVLAGTDGIAKWNGANWQPTGKWLIPLKDDVYGVKGKQVPKAKMVARFYDHAVAPG